MDRITGFFNRLSIPIGIKLYVKRAAAERLGIAYRTWSLLARELMATVAGTLPERRLRVIVDGGYARKEFVRRLSASVKECMPFHVLYKMLKKFSAKK